MQYGLEDQEIVFHFRKWPRILLFCQTPTLTRGLPSLLTQWAYRGLFARMKVDKKGNLPPCKAGVITSIPSRVTACMDTRLSLPLTYQSFMTISNCTQKQSWKMRSIKGNEELRFRTAGIRAEILVYIPGVSAFKLWSCCALVQASLALMLGWHEVKITRNVTAVPPHRQHYGEKWGVVSSLGKTDPGVLCVQEAGWAPSVAYQRGWFGGLKPPPRNSEDIGGVLDRMGKKNRRLDFLFSSLCSHTVVIY